MSFFDLKSVKELWRSLGLGFPLESPLVPLVTPWVVPLMPLVPLTPLASSFLFLNLVESLRSILEQVADGMETGYHKLQTQVQLIPAHQVVIRLLRGLGPCRLHMNLAAERRSAERRDL